MDSQVSMSREVSVFLVPMASSISATIYVSRLSADIREPGVTVSHLRLMSREVSVWIVRYLRTISREVSMWIVRYL